MNISLDSFNMYAASPDFLNASVSILMAFIIGTILAATYITTFEGLSYSKNFIQSLVLSPIVSGIAMQAIDGSLARGIGMMGAFSILRFRSNLKDPKDMFFLFASLSLGIASGVHAYPVAISGCICFCLVIVVLAKTPFTQSAHFDGLLRFNVEAGPEIQNLIADIMNKHCRRFTLVTLRDIAQGERLEYAYQIKLRAEDRQSSLVAEMQAIESVRGLHLLLQKATVEL